MARVYAQDIYPALVLTEFCLKSQELAAYGKVNSQSIKFSLFVPKIDCVCVCV